MDIWMYAKAFAVGGLLCAAGEVLLLFTKLTSARILVLYVVSGVVLSAVGLYAPFAEFAGSGASVPLTGFGHLLAEGTREAVERQGLLGALTGGLRASAGGIAAAVASGSVVGLLFRPGTKM